MQGMAVLQRSARRLDQKLLCNRRPCCFPAWQGSRRQRHCRILPVKLGCWNHSCWVPPRAGGGVRNAYDEPGKLGVDRWLAIVGAVARYGIPVVVWDLGTASTLDAVDTSGRHLGGMIYPGPATMAASLTRDTRLIVPPDLEGASTDPGQSTSSCIQNGVFGAQIGALNMFLRSVAGKVGRRAQTGHHRGCSECHPACARIRLYPRPLAGFSRNAGGLNGQARYGVRTQNSGVNRGLTNWVSLGVRHMAANIWVGLISPLSMASSSRA